MAASPVGYTPTGREGGASPAGSPSVGSSSRSRLLTEFDIRILRDVIELAERDNEGAGSPLTLLKVLRAYDIVLRRNDLVPSEDTFYYRTLLKLSLNPDTDWWRKLDQEIDSNRKRFAGIVGLSPDAGSGGPPAAPSAAGGASGGASLSVGGAGYASPPGLSVSQMPMYGGGGEAVRSPGRSVGSRATHSPVEVLAGAVGDSLRSWFSDAHGADARHRATKSPPPGGVDHRRSREGSPVSHAHSAVEVLAGPVGAALREQFEASRRGAGHAHSHEARSSRTSRSVTFTREREAHAHYGSASRAHTHTRMAPPPPPPPAAAGGYYDYDDGAALDTPAAAPYSGGSSRYSVGRDDYYGRGGAPRSAGNGYTNGAGAGAGGYGGYGGAPRRSAHGGEGVYGDYYDASAAVASEGRHVHPASFHNFRVLAHSFRAWTEAVAARKRYRREHEESVERWLGAVRHWERQLMQRCFWEWRQLVDDRIAAWEELADEHLRRNLRLAWVSFVDAVNTSRRMRKTAMVALEHWAFGVQRRLFRSWHLTAARRKPVPLQHPTHIWAAFKWMCLCVPDRGAVSSGAGALSADAPLGPAWPPLDDEVDDGGAAAQAAGWYSSRAAYVTAVSQRKGLRQYVLRRWTPRPTRLPLLEHANAVLDARLTQDIFASWADAARDVTDMRRRVELAGTRRLLRAWRTIAKVTRRLRERTEEGARRRNERNLRDAVLQWHAKTQWAKQLREIAGRIGFTSDRTVSKQALRHWIGAWRYRVALRERVAEAMMNRERYLCRRIVAEWRHVAHTAVKAQKFARMLSGKSQLLYFGRWCDYVKARRRKHALNTRAREWQRRWFMRRHLNEWHWYVRAWRNACNLEVRLVTMNVVKTWRTWAHHEAAQRRTLQLVADHFSSNVLKKSFKSWQLNASLQRAQKRRIAAAMAHRDEYVVKRLFMHWKVTAQLKRRLAAAIQASQQNRLHAAARSGIRRWRERAAKWRERREMKRDASYLFVSTMLVRVLRDWKRAADAQVKARRAFALAVEHRAGTTKRGVMLRWKRWARAQSTWHEDVAEKVYLMRVRHRFEAWRTGFHQRRHAEYLRMRVVTRMRNMCMVGAFDAWREYTEHQKSLKHEMAIMFGSRVRRTAHRVLVCWNTYVVHRRRKAKLEADSKRHREEAARARAWAAWRLAYKTRVKGHATEAMVRRAALKRTLHLWEDAWRTAAHHREVVQKCLWRMTHRIAVSAFNGWKGYTGRKLRLRAIEAETRDRWRDIMRRAFFHRWRDVAHWEAHSRAKMKGFLNALLHKEIARCFAAWAGWYQRKKHNEAVLAPVVRRMLHATAARALHAWRARVDDILERKAQLRHAAQVWTQAKTARAVRTWREWAAERVETRQKIRRAAAVWRNGTLVAVFRGWRRNARHVREARVSAEKMLLHWQNRVVAAAWDSWYAHHMECVADRARDARASKLLLQWKNARVASTFRTWEAWVSEQKEMRRRVTLSLKRMMHRAVASAFDAWAAFTEERLAKKAAVADALRHWQNAKVLAAVKRWRGWARARRERRTAIRHAVAHWNGGSLARCFDRWTEHTRESKEAKAAEGAAVRLWRNVAAGRAFRTWAEHAALLREERRKLTHAVALFQGNVAARAFGRWLDYAVDRVAKRQAVADAAYMWQTSKVRAAVRRLRWFARTRIERREKMRKAVAVLANGTLYRSFNAWQDFATKMSRARVIARKIMNRGLARAFAGWVDGAAARKRHRAILARMANVRLYRILLAWKRAAQSEKELSAGLTATMAKLAGFQTESLLLRILDAWRTEARLTRKMIQAAEVCLFGTKRRCFTRWRDEVRHNKVLDRAAEQVMERWRVLNTKRAFKGWRRRQLEERREVALMTRVLGRLANRFVAVAWRQWLDLVAQHRKVTRLLGRVMGRRQERYFFAWQDFVHRRRRERAVAAEVAQLHRLALQRTAWHEWHRRAALLKRVAGLIGSREMGTLARCMAMWRHGVAQEQWERDVVDRIQRFNQADEMGRAPGYVALPARALLRWRKVTMWKAWHVWHAQHTARRRTKLKVLAAMRHSDEHVLRRVLTAWRKTAATLRSLGMAARYFDSAVLGRCFGRLKRYMWLRRHRKALLAHAENHYRTTKVSAALDTWRARAAERKFKLNAYARIFAAHNKNHLALFWEAWRLVVVDARARRLQSMQAFAHAAMSATRRCFIAWAGWTGLRRERVAIVAHKAARLRALTAQLHLRAWREVAQYRKLLRDACDELAVRAMATRLRIRLVAWSAHTKRVRWCRRVAITFSTVALLSRCYRTWHGKVTRRKRDAENADAASDLASALLVKRVARRFAQWRRYATMQKAARAKYTHYLKGSLQPKCFAAWVAFWRHSTTRKSKVKRCLRHWQNRKLSATFMGWVAFHHAVREKREKMRLVLAHWQRKTALLCFTAWAGWTARRLRNSAAVDAARARAQKRAAATAFRQWHAFAHKRSSDRRNVIALLRDFDLRHKRMCFITWTHYWEHRRRRNAAKAKADKHFARTGKARGLRAWLNHSTEAAQKQQAVRRAALLWLGSTLSKYFQSWARIAAERKANKEKMRRAALRLQNAKVARAVAQWRDWTETRGHYKEVLKATTARMRNRAAAAAFASWAEFTARAKWDREVMETAVQKWKAGKMRAAVYRWMEWATNQQRLKAIVKAAMKRRLDKSLGDVFEAWRDYVAWALECREKIGGFAELLRGRSKQACFDTWVAAYEEAKAEREKLNAAKKWFARGVYGKYFHLWLEKHTHQRQLRHAAAWMRNSLMVRCIEHWRENVRIRKIARLIARRDDDAKEAAFSTWRTNVEWAIKERALKKQAVAYFVHANLIRTFTTWKVKTQTIVAVRKLFGGAQARDKRMRFDRWRAWATHARKIRKAGDALSFLTGQQSARVVWDKWRTAFHLVRHRRGVILRGKFGRWKAFLVLTKLKRNRIESARSFLGRGTALRALVAWRDLAKASALYRAHLTRLHEFRMRQEARRRRWRVHTLRVTVTSWRAYASRAALTRKLADQFRFLHGPAKFFKLWRAQAAEWRATRAKISAAMSMGDEASKRYYFHRWTEGVAEQQNERDALALAAEHDLHRLRSKMLRAWRQEAHKMVRARGLLQRIMSASLETTFHAWARETRVLIHARGVSEADRVRRMQSRFTLWAAFARQSKRARVAEMLAGDHCKGVTLRRSFDTWEEWATRNRVTRERVQAGLKRMFQGLKRRCWGGWRLYVEIQRKKKRAGLFFVGNAKRRAFAMWTDSVKVGKAQRLNTAQWRRRAVKAMRAWREYAHREHYVKNLLAAHLERVRWGNGAMAFDRWRDNAKAQREERVATEAATAHYLGTLVGKTFEALAVHAERQRVLNEENTGVADSYWVMMLARRALKAWHKHTQIRSKFLSYVGGAADDMAARRGRALKRTAMNAWKDVTARRRRAREMMASHPEMWRRRAFVAWRTYVRDCAVERAGERRADDWYRRRLMANCMTVWRGQAYSELVHSTARRRWDAGEGHVSSINEVLGLL